LANKQVQEKEIYFANVKDAKSNERYINFKIMSPIVVIKNHLLLLQLRYCKCNIMLLSVTAEEDKMNIRA